MSYDPPKINKLKYFITLGRFVQLLAAAITIAGVCNIDKFSNHSEVIIYPVFLISVVVALLIYIWVISSRKLHRYADIPPYTHYVNHSVRTVLTKMRRKMAEGTFSEEDKKEIDAATTSMLDAISSCFTILTGSVCGVCIKELVHDESNETKVRIASRDSNSKITRGSDDGNQSPHSIEDDTPCYKAAAPGTGNDRGYLCNNVKREWCRSKFKTPSFLRYGGCEPSSVSIFGYPLVFNWKLHYISTMVSPIRYQLYPEDPSAAVDPHTKFQPSSTRICWGLLCVDAKKRNLFVESRHRDVIATFSDALFIYFNELHDIISAIYGAEIKRVR